MQLSYKFHSSEVPVSLILYQFPDRTTQSIAASISSSSKRQGRLSSQLLPMLSISSTSTSLFRHFFPQFYSYFGLKFQSQCQQQIQIYHSSTSIPSINHNCDNVINCIQGTLSEKDKLVLAVTAVLLGLAPTGEHLSLLQNLAAVRTTLIRIICASPLHPRIIH